MSLAEFCHIIGVGNVGKTDRMKSHPSKPRALSDSLCSGDLKEIRRGKISRILFPHIRYLAYYIARGVLARENTSNITDPDLAIWAAALEGDDTSNIGTLLARLLATNGDKGL